MLAGHQNMAGFRKFFSTFTRKEPFTHSLIMVNWARKRDAGRWRYICGSANLIEVWNLGRHIHRYRKWRDWSFFKDVPLALVRADKLEDKRMASRLIRNQLPERVAGSTPVSSAWGTAVTGGAFFCRAGQAREESGITSQRDSITF